MANLLDILLQKAGQGVSGVSKAVGEGAADAGSFIKGTGEAWARLPWQIAGSLHGDPIKPAPEMSAQEQRGRDIIQGLLMPGVAESKVTEAIPSAKNAMDYGAADASNTFNAAQTQPGGLQAGFIKTLGDTGKAAEASVIKPSMITTRKIATEPEAQALANYASIFDVPRRKAQNFLVSPITVVKQLIDDGFTGLRGSPYLVGQKLREVANSVTGENGVFPRINNYILKNMDNPVDYSAAQDSIKNNLPAALKGEKEGFVNEINKEVSQAMKPLNYDVPGELPIKNAPASGQAWAPDLFQTSQNLRQIASMYKRKAYTDMGELNHPELERASNAIMEIKNNIDDAISNSISPKLYQAYKQDPAVLAELNKLPNGGQNSPLAQRWLQGAEKFKDGQTIQAPYVNLSHMLDDTEDTMMSVWTKAAKAMQGGGGPGIGQKIASNIPAPQIIKKATGGLIDLAAKPFTKSAADIMADLTSGKVAGEGAKMKGLKNLLVGSGIVGAGIGGMSLQKILSGQQDNQSTYAGSEEQTKKGEQSHITSDSIPQMRYSVKSDPLKSGQIIKTADFQSQYNEYTKQIANLHASGNVVEALRKQGEQQALKDTYDSQQDLRSKWTDPVRGTGNVLTVGNSAYEALKKADPNFLNALPGAGPWSYDKLMKSSNKDMARLGGYLAYVSNATGVDFTQYKTKDALIGALDSALNNVTTAWDTTQSSYGAPQPINRGAAQALPINKQSSQPVNFPPGGFGGTGNMSLDNILQAGR